MSSRFFHIRPSIALVCVLALLWPSLMSAITNDGYQGNTISGRPSIVVVSAPGGTKVNTLLGNLFLSRSDLRIPGRGLPLEIQFAYNSNQNGIASPFGFGWTFNYGMRCLLSASRNVVVQWADGRSDLYQYKAGVYTPYNSSVFASLALVGGFLQLTTKEQIRFFFDTSHGLLQRIQDPNGNALTFANNGGLLTAITDASGRNISLNYDANGHVIQINDPNSSPARMLRYAYDANGNQSSFTDPLGNVTTYSYDSGHRLTQVTDPLGITTIAYGLPNMTVATVSRSTLTNTVLSTRSFSYSVAALATTVTDQLDSTTTASTRYQYDAHFRLIQTTDPLGHVEARTYDSHGNIATVTDPNGNTNTYTYDNEGNILSVTDALGHVTRFTYDPLYNKVASRTDANGNTTSYTYDSRGNLATRQDALSNVTRYSYDALGQLVSRQNPRGFTTTFTYDSLGDQTGMTDPLGRSQNFVYDSVGNGLSRTDGNNQTTHYSYDARDRVVAVVFPDSSQAAFTYDPQDKILSATDPNTDLRFVYDADERTAQVADNKLAKTISYQYDGVGNRVQMADPEGAVTTYSYDLASRLATISRSGQFTFTYDNADRLTGSTLPNGAFTSYTYDNANHLLSLANRKSDSSVISSFGYQYDNAGNRVSMGLVSGDTVNYSYDGDDQLVRETRIGTTAYDHQFSYDPVGNRMQLNAGGTITSYAYDNADELTQEMTGANSIAYQYDGDGNRLGKTAGGTVSTYSYDFNNQLIGFASATSNASYAIDAFGRRASKTVSGSTTRYFYDRLDAVAEYDGAGALQAQNLFGICGFCAAHPAGIDQHLARLVGGSNFYFLHDGLNSTRNIVDATQAVQNTYDYDAWGNILAKVENVPNDYTFTGRQADGESGLYYYRARMYDQSTGRFNQVDPIDFNISRGSYAYVDNNPAARIDPTGRWWEGLVGACFADPPACLTAALLVIVAVVVVVVIVVAVRTVFAAASPPKPQPYNPKMYNSDDDDDYGPSNSKGVVAVANGANDVGCTGADASYAQGSMAF